MTVTWKKDYLKDRVKELQSREFLDNDLHTALELIQELLGHMIEEHGLFKDDH